VKNVIHFITPGPLGESYKFSARVFTSWIFLGFVLGLILGVIGLSANTADPMNTFFGSLITVPIIVCILGLIGLGVSSIVGAENDYPGWLWYLFPIVTYLILGLWIAFTIIAVLFSFAGINLPKPKFDSGKIRKQKPKDFLEEQEKLLVQKQEEERERLEHKKISNVEKEERLKSLSIRERILKKLRESSSLPLEEVLSEEELEELILMIIEARPDSD
jgi:uncharacterized membrane protein YgaE (UPF0421/DUF939 family)